jgi:hypothetical protein
VRLRTSLIISLQNIISTSGGRNLKANDIQGIDYRQGTPLLEGNDDLALAGRVSKESIDSLSRQIKATEKAVEGRIHFTNPYDHLLSIPGVGPILGSSIMLETGPVSRFRKVGNHVSYLTAEKFLLGSLATKGRKALATGEMAMRIWHVRIPRHQNMRDGIIPQHGTFSIAS